MSFSMLANKELHQISAFTIRAVEAQRIFELIQQNIDVPKQVMTAQNMSSFITKYYPNEINKGNKIIKALNAQDNQLNTQVFKVLLPCRVKETQLNSLTSLINYYQAIYNFFIYNYTKKNQLIDKWDIQVDSQAILTEEFVQTRKNYIKNSFDKVKNSISLNQITYQNLSQQLFHINFCYSIQAITDNQDDIKTIFNSFTIPIIINCLSEFLYELRNNIVNKNYTMDLNKRQNFFANIAHLYGACKYKTIKQIIQSSQLFFLQTYQILFQALEFEEKDTRQIIVICIAYLAKYSQNFIPFLIQNLVKYLQPILNQSRVFNNPKKINYSLVCIKNILKSLRQKVQLIYNNQIYKSYLSKINQSIVQQLKKQAKFIDQKQCIYILNQILMILNYSQDQSQILILINQIFSANQTYQIGLGEAVLHILECSILNKKQQFTQSIIKHQSFINSFIRHISNSNSPLFLPFIHISYLLSFEYSSFLIQKGIFAIIINLIDGPTSVLLSLISDIVYNVVLQGLRNQKILQLLYNKFALLDKIIPFVILKCFDINQDVNALISKLLSNTPQTPKNFNYFNKTVFVNVFKIIFCISVCVSRNNKKFSFSKIIIFDLLNSISIMIGSLFTISNQNLVKTILFEPIKFENIDKLKKYEKQGKPFYKIIDFILQELTYNSQKKTPQMLKLIYLTKKSFCNNLKRYISLNVLESQNIPIYLTLNINIVIRMQNKNFKRDIPHNFTYNQIKSYIKYLISRLLQVKQTQIFGFSSINGQKQINEVTYKIIVKKTLEHLRPFIINLDIVNVQIKKVDSLSRSFVMPIRNNGQTSTMRSNFNQNNASSNFGTTRNRFFPRQFSNNNQSMRSTDNVRSASSNPYYQSRNQRSLSPAFNDGNQS